MVHDESNFTAERVEPQQGGQLLCRVSVCVCVCARITLILHSASPTADRAAVMSPAFSRRTDWSRRSSACDTHRSKLFPLPVWARAHTHTHTHSWNYTPWICSWSRSRNLLGRGLNASASSLSFFCCRCCSSSLLLLCTSSCSSSSSLQLVLVKLPLLAELQSCSRAPLLLHRLLLQDGAEGSRSESFL